MKKLLYITLTVLLTIPITTQAQVTLTAADNGFKSLSTANGGNFALLRGTSSISSWSTSQTGASYFTTGAWSGAPGIASVASGSSSGNSFRLQITNNTGATITDLSLNGSSLQYKDNSSNLSETLVASGVTGASGWNITVGSDGNNGSTVYSTPLVTSMSGTLSGYSFTNGSTITITWSDTNDGGTDAMFGLGAMNLAWTAPLPVELAYVSVTHVNSGSKIAFGTESETNNDRFEIERSADGQRFSKIGEVKGAGNSQVALNYYFIDENPLAGINYYRLKQVDFDGNFDYSKIVSLEHGTIAGFTIFPVPANDNISIRLNETHENDIRWQLADLSGRLWQEGILNADQLEHQVPATALAPGAYVLRLISSQAVMTRSFVKQ